MIFSKKTSLWGIAAIVSSCSVSAIAQSYNTTIDTTLSSAQIDSEVVFETAGTLIGDYDAKSNPSGTQTRPGFFGGTGNQPINTSLSFTADSMLDSDPAGSMSIELDTDLGIISIEGLSIDLLNGNPGATNLSFTLFYETFHTVSPTFLYPGGLPFTLPLGEIGSISEAQLTQSIIGAGTVTVTEDPAVYDISLLVPASLDMQIELSLPGTDSTSLPIDALPIVLPVTGQLEMMIDGSIELSLALSPDPIELEIPIEGISLPDFPLELPAFGEDSASLVYSSAPNSINLQAALGLTIIADGTESGCAADMNNDGELNFFDVSAFLASFAAMDPSADFTGEGELNFFDVSAFLAEFSSGCP